MASESHLAKCQEMARIHPDDFVGSQKIAGAVAFAASVVSTPNGVVL
jgi:hypothetical protein